MSINNKEPGDTEKVNNQEQLLTLSIREPILKISLF